jgi:hypothetical protein
VISKSYLQRDTCWRYCVTVSGGKDNKEVALTRCPHRRHAYVLRGNTASEVLHRVRRFPMPCTGWKSAKRRSPFFRTYTVRRESSGSSHARQFTSMLLADNLQHRNPSERGFQRLIEDITHLIFDCPPISRVRRHHRNNSQFCAATSGLNRLRQ